MFIFYRDMVKKYRHSEFMWQKLAKIHFDGFIYHHETEQLHYDKNYISGIRFIISIIEFFRNMFLLFYDIYNCIYCVETVLKPMKMD